MLVRSFKPISAFFCCCLLKKVTLIFYLIRLGKKKKVWTLFALVHFAECGCLMLYIFIHMLAAQAQIPYFVLTMFIRQNFSNIAMLLLIAAWTRTLLSSPRE